MSEVYKGGSPPKLTDSRTLSKLQPATALSHILLGLSGLLAASDGQAANYCSLRCETIRSDPSSATSSFNKQGVDQTNAQLRLRLRARTAALLVMRGKGMVMSVVAGSVPGGGGLATAIDKGYDAAASAIDSAMTKDISNFLAADIAWRIKHGETEQDVRGHLQANAEATIADLIGPNSAYPDIAEDATAYDRLQDGAITILARKLDDVIAHANQTNDNLQTLKTETQTRLKSLDGAKGDLATAKAAANKTANSDVLMDGKNAEKEALPTASSKSKAVAAVNEIRAQDIARVAKTASEQFDAASTILANTGNPEAAKALGTLSKVANIVSGLAMSYANPLAILPTLASITSLFGGDSSGQPDPYLVAILQAVEQVNQNVNKLRNEMEKYHREEMAELNKIETGLVGLLGVMDEQEDASLRQCNNLIASTITISPGNTVHPLPQWAWDEPPGKRTFDGILLNAVDLRPVTFADIQREWNAKFSSIQACHAALQRVLPNIGLPGRFAIQDLLGEIQSGKTSIADPTTIASPNNPNYERYSASIRVAQWVTSVGQVISHSDTLSIDGRDVSKAIWAFSDPALTVLDLDSRISNLESIAVAASRDPDLTPQTRREYTDWLTEHPADADLISRVASYTLVGSWWREFIKPGYVLKQQDELDEASADPVTTEMARAGDALRIAVAQQAIVDGDLLVPLFYHRLFLDDAGGSSIPGWFHRSKGNANAPDPSDIWWKTDARSDFDRMLSKNAVAAANLGIYFVHSRLKKLGSSFTQYDVAWASSDPATLVQVLGSPGSYVRVKDRWYLRRHIGEGASTGNASGESYDLPLPDPAEIRAGDLHLTKSFQTASVLWSQVSRELVTYTFSPTSAAARKTAVDAARSRALQY